MEQVKRGRGRPKGTRGTNQYTGRRAENIDYVRKALRVYIEQLPESMDILSVNDSGKAAEAVADLHKMRMLALRLLLVIEGVTLRHYTSDVRDNLQRRISKLGSDYKQGSITMPSLLAELDVIAKEKDEDEPEI